jgi:ABC-type transport system involved in multi-copper enzyme maturation permease subunit
VLTLLGNVSRGAVGTILKAIPNYFIGTNFSVLLNDQGQYLSYSASSTPAVSVLHAIIVLLVYFAFFIGLAWWINKRRDVTN